MEMDKCRLICLFQNTKFLIMTPVQTYLWGNGSHRYDECEIWVSSYEVNVWVTFG